MLSSSRSSLRSRPALQSTMIASPRFNSGDLKPLHLDQVKLEEDNSTNGTDTAKPRYNHVEKQRMKDLKNHHDEVEGKYRLRNDLSGRQKERQIQKPVQFASEQRNKKSILESVHTVTPEADRESARFRPTKNHTVSAIFISQYG
jgi:hypothetical protein